MSIEKTRVETAEALRLARLNREDWNSAIRRGLYPDAPPVEPGRARLFDLDDLTAAYVLGQLLEREVMQGFACQIACDVLKIVRQTPAVASLSAWKCFKPDGSPYVVVTATRPQRGAVELFKFGIAKIRATLAAGIREKTRGS
ncbi:MAG: hypothetical protein M3Y22_05800 [Pseudomonadota bacterium]|nr:hypothetical protein [Pseudomonadota bacterium]